MFICCLLHSIFGSIYMRKKSLIIWTTTKFQQYPAILLSVQKPWLILMLLMSFPLFVFDSTLKQLCHYDSSLSSVLSPTGELTGGSLLSSCCVLHSWCCLQPGPLSLLLKLPFHCYPWILLWLPSHELTSDCHKKTLVILFEYVLTNFSFLSLSKWGSFHDFIHLERISISIKKVFSFDIYHLNHTKQLQNQLNMHSINKLFY